MPHAGMKTLVASLLASAAAASCTLLPTATSDLSLDTIGNRADLVSGGDVLVRALLPASADPAAAQLSINGGVTAALHRAPDGKGYVALVTGLVEGKNMLTLTNVARSVSLTVTNHPNGGPLFSGPQIQPWTCRDGATSAQCDRPTTYAFSYMPKAGGKFAPYDPAKPAADVATTTTSDGAAVPYIVRTESFAQNRSGVSVAVLFDPAKPWTPMAPQPQWNGGVFVLQGSGCGTGFTDQPAGDPLNDRALKQGFAVVTVALLHNTINCNPVVQAEAAMMAKEHVAETYGPFDFVFAQGSSGGAISQLMDQNLYPGVYDGLILNHLFADSDASRANAYDCRMVSDAWGKAATPWTDEQKSAVAGMLSGCASSPTRFQIYNPSVGTSCNVADNLKFDAVKNPKGVRCTLQDYEVNQVGRRPDGYAPGRMDTVGVQFGLKALMSGKISPAQFVDLNAAIGGHDINFNPIPTRTEADRSGLSNLYRSGLNNTLNNLASTPIIETRLSVTDFHQPFHAVMVRARLDRAQGSHENYALWRTPGAREAAMDASFDVMVAWIKAIKADGRNVPQSQKVLDNRPSLAKDRCIVEGADAPLASCPRPPELVRVLAGAPDTNDIGKCQLKPLRAADYGAVTFTATQWSALQKTFPSGVCDYAKPLVDFRMSEPWLRYTGDGKASAMGAAPASR
jgi:Tannase-like family of unknown function (DUF6351)